MHSTPVLLRVFPGHRREVVQVHLTLGLVLAHAVSSCVWHGDPVRGVLMWPPRPAPAPPADRGPDGGGPPAAPGPRPRGRPAPRQPAPPGPGPARPPAPRAGV